MTHAGTITVGVDIDASAIRAELTEAIREAVLPAIAEMNRELGNSATGYKNVGRAAENSATRQVLSLGRVINKLKEARRAALAYRAALGGGGPNGGVGAAGFGNTTIRNDNRTINNNRTDNRYDRRVITNNYYRGSPGPDGGGGGGGSGGGRSGRSGGRGGGGNLRTTGILNLGALGAAGLPAAASAIVSLTGAIQQLGQAGLVVPGVMAGIAASVGTAAIGFKGMGDAVKALNEAAASGDPKDLEKATAALKDMAPAAVEVAKSVSAFTQGPWKELQKAVAQEMFTGVAKDFDDFTGKVLPRAQRGLSGIARSWNGTLKEILRVGGGEKVGGLMDRIFGNTAEGQTRANKAIEPFINAFGKLAAVGSDFLPRLGDALGSVAKRFEAFIDRNEKNGNLFRWIDEGLNGLRSFGNSILNVLKIITGLTKAAGALDGSLSGDGGLLGSLERGSGALADFINSAEGQEKLTSFFADARESAGQWMDVIKSLLPVIREVIAGFQQWGDILLPIIKGIADALTSLGGGNGAIASVVTAFLAWKTIGGIIGGVGGMLGGLPGQATVAATGITAALKKIVLPAAVAGAVFSQTDGFQAPDAGAGERLAGLGINVGTGAAAGFVAGGPIGAAVGALIGAGVTLFQGARQQLEEGKAEWEKSWQEHHDNPDRPGNPDEANRLTGQDVRNQPSLATPSALPALQQFIQGGGAAGFTIAPDGTVIGPAGALPGLNLAPQNLGPALPPSSLTDKLGITAPPVTPNSPLPVQIVGPAPGGPAAPVPALPGAVTPAPAGTSTPTDLGGLLGVGDVAPAREAVADLKTEITSLPEGEVKIKDATPDVIKNLEGVDAKITQVSENEMIVKADTKQAQAAIDKIIRDVQSRQITLKINAAATPGAAPAVPGRKYGGPIFGGIIGRDSVPIMAQHGEFVLDTGDVARMGGVAGVEQFRRGLESGAVRRFAEGGPVIGSVPGLGPLPGPADDNSELGVLRQIRDLLAGKGGPASNPLAQTADGVQSLVTAGTGGAGGGTDIGPFGTPRKRGNPAYDAAAAAISALGGDPEKFLGADPSTYAPAGAAGTGAITGGVVSASVAAALKAFASSGDTAALAGTGLGINDPVVTALTSARNKGKGGLSDEAIGGLVDQVLTGGGFSGALDSSNTALVKALTRYHDKVVKGTGGTASVAGAMGIGTTAIPGGIDAAILSQIPKGSYTSGPGDLTKGLADCSSAVEDLVNIIDGQPTAGRSMNTGNEAEFLLSRGFQENTTGANIPGALNIGMNAGHTQATLPNGTNFNWGSDAAAAAGGLNGDGAFGAGLTKQFYRMVGAGGLGAVAGMDASGASVSAGGVQSVFVTNWPGQPVSGGPGAPGGLGGAAGPGGATNYLGKSVVDAATQGVAGVAGDLAGTAIDGLFGSATNAKIGSPTGPGTNLGGLLTERNPLALASAFGLDVPDYTRQGGEGSVDHQGPSFDAKGRMFSDTGTLVDRSFTDLQASMAAQFDQQMAVLNQIKEQLGEKVVKPVTTEAVTAGIEGIGDRVTNDLGRQIGETAAPIIAAAVKDAVSNVAATAAQSNTGVTDGTLGIPIPKLFDEGGIMPHASTGINLSGHPERVLDPRQTRLFDAGLLGGWNAQPQQQNWATQSGVSGNDTVGADFFGVSQVPIIGTIVNLLVKVLLKILGVEIESRDTLDEAADSVRQFRGDFQKFDATGRLINDTSGLLDRSGTSEQAAADERVRVLKIVLEALVDFIINKIVIPIGKAVAQAAISAVGSAAGAATNSVAPGAGGIVSSLIGSGGSAGVDIFADIFSTFISALIPVVGDAVGDGLQSYFPDFTKMLFGGNLLASLFDPVTGILSALLSPLTGGLGGGIAGIFSALLGGLAFDEGGIASGTGLMPKATIAPERVLSPNQTALFERMVTALENGKTPSGGDTHIHAPFTVTGGASGGKAAHNRLLELLGS